MSETYGEDRWTNTEADAGEWERHRAEPDDDRPTLAELNAAEHEPWEACPREDGAVSEPTKYGAILPVSEELLASVTRIPWTSMMFPTEEQREANRLWAQERRRYRESKQAELLVAVSGRDEIVTKLLGDHAPSEHGGCQGDHGYEGEDWPCATVGTIADTVGVEFDD